MFIKILLIDYSVWLVNQNSQPCLKNDPNQSYNTFNNSVFELILYFTPYKLLRCNHTPICTDVITVFKGAYFQENYASDFSLN